MAKRRTIPWLAVAGLVLAAGRAGAQDSRPADPPAVEEIVIDDLDAFLEQSPEASYEPLDDEDPVNPFAGARPWSRPDSRPGALEMSDGTTVAGYLFTTRGRGWRLYDPQADKYRDIPPILVRSIEAVVLWERLDPEWRWEKMGQDRKVFTGRHYPNRMLEYKFTLLNGRTLQGAIAQPLTVEWRNERQKFLLHKRQKGEPDQTLAALAYVTRITFSLQQMQAVRAAQAASRPATRPASRPAPGEAGQ